MQEVDNFFNRWNGQPLDVDNFPAEQPYQCVDLFHKFNSEILGVGYIAANPVGGALDYFNNFDGLGLSQWYEIIGNDMSNPDQLPQKGDFMIWGVSMGTFGHIALVQSANKSSFTSLDQNFGARYCRFVTHSWTERPLGWIRPKKFIAVTPTIEANQRVVGAVGVNHRAAPSTSSQILREWGKDEVLTFKGFVRGENVSGNNIWYVGYYSGGYLWSGSFENPITTGLDDLTPTVPNPTPLTPEEPKYNFTKDLNCVTEVIPAATTNFQYGNFPIKPTNSVVHQFGAVGIDTYESTINTFKKKTIVEKEQKSSHFVVSKKKITQSVSLKDRAYHAGPNGNNNIGIESDPAQDAETVTSVKLLLKQLHAKYGYELAPIKHSSIMLTSCGTAINLDNYIEKEPGVPTPPPASDIDKENNNILKQILAILKSIFNIK